MLTRTDEDKLNVVWDLDHTLIHSKDTYDYNSQDNTVFKQPDATVRLKSNKDDSEHEYEYHVFTRPFSHFILSQLSTFTKLHIYTAATPDYADKIIKKCYKDIPFNQKLYRENCIKHRKDLDLIEGKRKILVDDRNYTHMEGQSFYHIPPYYFYNKTDWEMIKLFYAILMRS